MEHSKATTEPSAPLADGYDPSALLPGIKSFHDEQDASEAYAEAPFDLFSMK
jgi:hypothetical protein